MEDWWERTFPNGKQTIAIALSNGQSIQIAYGEKGKGIPVVLVHGIGSWSFGWRYLIDPLAKEFRAIAFDAAGHGFSERPADWTISGLKAELKQVVQKLCDHPPIVIAQSLGALITLAAACEDPALFSRLVLINVPIFPAQLPSGKMRLLANLPLAGVQIVDRLRLAKCFAPLVRAIVRGSRREVVANPQQIMPEDVFGITYPYIERVGAITHFARTLQQAASQIEQLEKSQPNLISQVQDNLDAVTIPTLILWGDKDAWFPVADGVKLHTRLPNSQMKILSDCGHDAAGSAPQQVHTAVLAFLEQTKCLEPGR